MPRDDLPDYGETDILDCSSRSTKSKKSNRLAGAFGGGMKKLLHSPGTMARLVRRHQDKKRQNRLSRMRPSTLMKDPSSYDNLSEEDKNKLDSLMKFELDL